MTDPAVVRLVEQVLQGHDAVVVDPETGGAPLLAEAARRLQQRGCRTIAVAAPEGGLTLPALLAQVAGGAGPEADPAQDDTVLERGFDRLTVAEPGCDRIVLLVTGADTMQGAVARYLAFAGKATEVLRLVLAGHTDPIAALGPEMAPLRARLTACPPLAPAAAAPAAPERQPRRRGLVLPALVLAALLGAGVWWVITVRPGLLGLPAAPGPALVPPSR